MNEMEMCGRKTLYPGYEDTRILADNFAVGQNTTASGIPYMILTAAVAESLETFTFPLSVAIAERLGWSLIESAQKHRIINDLEG
ncbi:hypothetical protein [Mycobacteroides chelonae]|uniref:hypothetical protein n=1 Tax=Mycobacteroides chelonae TaxID=1774 RepID=UPI0008A9616D|nr:hypothetical protein [Mycobacteroides chelonae]OHT47963.1 hypothetical protein BKG63_24400 [Mycobacteroides chelonae]OHT99607.1 hypothetical protein BKG72_04070 [Mycobacteroides chelonae]